MKCVLEEETNTSFCVHVCKNCSVHAEATKQRNKNHLTAVLVQHVDDFNDANSLPTAVREHNHVQGTETSCRDLHTDPVVDSL